MTRPGKEPPDLRSVSHPYGSGGWRQEEPGNLSFRQQTPDHRGFLRPGSEEQNAPAPEDCRQSHRDRVGGHLFRIFKMDLIGLPGGLGESHHLGLTGEWRSRFIEPDMTVHPDSQHLQVNSPGLPDHLLVTAALRLRFPCHPIGKMSRVPGKYRDVETGAVPCKRDSCEDYPQPDPHTHPG